MLIGIDGNEANVERRVGIGEYAFEMLIHFYEIQSPTQSGTKFKIYLKNKPADDFPKEEDWWQYNVFGPEKLWTQLALPFNLYFARPRPDVFFTPSHYAPRFSPAPTAISIMDLSYIHFPEMFKTSDLYQLENWTKYSVKKAKKIFTISKASKDDIIREYKIPEDRVVVTYPGIKVKSQMSKVNPDKSGQNSKLLKEKYDIDGNYILFVGTLQPRKNIVRLIEAFSRVINKYSSSDPDLSGESRSKFSTRRVPYGTVPFGTSQSRTDWFWDGNPSSSNNNLQLVVVGKKGWLYEEILKAPKKFGIENRVKFLDFVPDDDLPLFYKNALCFVLPSLYEGFGLPVLEAMQYGCPVITSNVSSLPEAGGDAALYIDPLNVDDIASKIKMVIDDKKVRRDLIEKGKKQIKKFSWEKTAKETLKALESIR